MVKKTPVFCPHCGVQVTTKEGLMYYVLPEEGLKCPKCGKVVIERPKIIW